MTLEVSLSIFSPGLAFAARSVNRDAVFWIRATRMTIPIRNLPAFPRAPIAPARPRPSKAVRGQAGRRLRSGKHPGLPQGPPRPRSRPRRNLPPSGAPLQDPREAVTPVAPQTRARRRARRQQSRKTMAANGPRLEPETTRTLHPCREQNQRHNPTCSTRQTAPPTKHPPARASH